MTPRRTKHRSPEREAEQEHGRSGESPAVSATTVSPDEQGRSTNTSLTGQTPTPSNEGHADIPEEQRRTQTWRRGRRVREDAVSALEGASRHRQFGPSWSSSQLIGRLCVSQDSQHTLTHASAQKDALVNQPISCWEHGTHAGLVLQSEDILETRNLERPSSFPGFSTGQT